MGAGLRGLMQVFLGDDGSGWPWANLRFGP
jgi:hypothetical protein